MFPIEKFCLAAAPACAQSAAAQYGRYAMDYVRLGNTRPKVSRLCLGCMTDGSSKWRAWVLDDEVKALESPYEPKRVLDHA
jgi:hypothetical protein